MLSPFFLHITTHWKRPAAAGDHHCLNFFEIVCNGAFFIHPDDLLSIVGGDLTNLL